MPLFSRSAFGVLLLTAAAAEARAQQPVDASGLPPGVTLSAQSIRTEERDGSIVAEGAVTIESAMGRFQADRVTVRDRRFIEAAGNVLVVWGENRISGTSMVYDMGRKDDPNPALRIARGTIENAVGQVEPEFYFVARKVETIGRDRVIVYDASVTTCTQPVPHWSFAVSKAKIKLEGYAHLFNLRPKIKKVPFFYLPYLAWPVKRDRAPGLLFPEFGTTNNRGETVSIPVFVPLGASADVTLFGEYYTVAGWGGGAKLRAIPNRQGYAEAQGSFIADQVTGDLRYRALFKQTQSFLNGFRMVSDVDIVSDFAYYTDFLRNLTYSSSPTILGRMSFTRSGAWTSLLVQEQYREQLFADGTTLRQSTFPELEWRGRSRQLGKTPLYLSYVSSFAMIRQKGSSVGAIDADYWRADAGPTLALPFSPRPWIDITPTVALRETYWSQTLAGEGGLNRALVGGGIDFRGPKLYRLFQKKDDPKAAKYKNTIEPRLVYTYQQAYDRNDEIIVYDEVDRFGFNANTLTYGLASRLIAQRPRAAPETDAGSGERILVPATDSATLREAPTATPQAEGEPPPGETPEADRPLEPIEVGSLEVSQSYSFNSNLSVADLDGDPTGTLESTSSLSGVQISGRYNPGRNMSFNLTGRYDILYHDLSEMSLSGNFRQKIARGLFSVVYRPGLGFDRAFGADPDGAGPLPAPVIVTPREDATQLRFQGDFGPLAGRLRLGTDFTMNVNPVGLEKRLPYRRWRVEYYTQCCGFLAEYLINEYTSVQRNEFRIAVDLRGIGKLFDFSQGYQ
jgi:lipopolysaccharide assembly outer membrane protein LptD (OstA)